MYVVNCCWKVLGGEGVGIYGKGLFLDGFISGIRRLFFNEL